MFTADRLECAQNGRTAANHKQIGLKRMARLYCGYPLAIC